MCPCLIHYWWLLIVILNFIPAASAIAIEDRFQLIYFLFILGSEASAALGGHLGCYLRKKYVFSTRKLLPSRK